MNRHVASTATHAATSENAPSSGARRTTGHELLCGVAAQDAIAALFNEYNVERPLNARSFAKSVDGIIGRPRS